MKYKYMDSDMNFGMWLEEASYNDLSRAVVSYRQELEDALDRVKQLDIIVRDMKAFHYQPINDDYSDSDIDDLLLGRDRPRNW